MERIFKRESEIIDDFYRKESVECRGNVWYICVDKHSIFYTLTAEQQLSAIFKLGQNYAV